MNETQFECSYTPRQVADLLGYKVSSIYALLSRNEMQASTIGRNRRISHEQLNEFIRKRNNLEVIIDYTK